MSEHVKQLNAIKMSVFFGDFRPESVVETVLHCGLFIGALFQLIFIFAVVFTPPKKEEIEISEEDPPVSASSSAYRQSDLTFTRKRADRKKKKLF